MKSSVHFYYGEEDFLLEEAGKALKSQCSRVKQWAFSKKEEVGELTHFLVESLAPTLFPEPTLVWIDGQALFNKALPDTALAAWVPHLASLLPHFTVLFTARTLHAENALGKWLLQHATVAQFSPLPPWKKEAWVAWIDRRVRQLGKTIDREAANFLRILVGPSLGLLAQEVEKLCLYVSPRSRITEQDVTEVVGSYAIDVFSLVQAVREKKIDEALARLTQLVRQGEPLLSLLHLLVSQLRPLFQMKRGQEAGLSFPEMKQRMRIHPFVFQKNQEACRRFSGAGLAVFWRQALSCNVALKTKVVSSSILEQLLFSLCSDGSPR